ncbi:PqqD family protein [uncultured Thomasclavelia sp.]|uniref:PqqD family protein n=1 Tax=uncultured Thomasclavelia sp. TaxID=3025759 RepID=UPI0025F44DAC|nr:PqqD family protein [uncultured Thomasclavelia sp.]
MEEKKYQIKSGFLLREVADEYVIIPIEAQGPIANAVMAPNDTAVFLWKAFESPKTINDVVKMALEQYEATEEVIRNSVIRFVADSLKYNIMEEIE